MTVAYRICAYKSRGQPTTSPTEASNKMVKSYLIKDNTTVKQLAEALAILMEDMRPSTSSWSRTRSAGFDLNSTAKSKIGDAANRVTYKAINNVEDEYRKAHGWLTSNGYSNPANRSANQAVQFTCQCVAVRSSESLVSASWFRSLRWIFLRR